ncbi:MAG: AbrB family transcriptional regulator, partial [Sedimentibacter sp.]
MDVGYEILLLVTLSCMFVLGFIGFKLFEFIKIPAPALTGSLFTNAIATSMGANWVNIPIEINIFLQILIGIMIGSQFNNDKIKQIKNLALPGLIVALWMVIVGLGLGFLIAKLTNIDLGTALFSAAPGGLSEMSILAITYKLDVPKVVMFQFLRIVVVYFTVPIMAFRFHNTLDNKSNLECIISNVDNKSNKEEYHLAFTFLIGTLSGFIAWKIGIPAGGIIGPIFVVGGFRCINYKIKALPKKYIAFAQIGLGASLGLTFTPDVAKSLLDLIGISTLFTLIMSIN